MVGLNRPLWGEDACEAELCGVAGTALHLSVGAAQLTPPDTPSPTALSRSPWRSTQLLHLHSNHQSPQKSPIILILHLHMQMRQPASWSPQLEGKRDKLIKLPSHLSGP